MTPFDRLGRVGVWSRRLRGKDRSAAAGYAIELDRLGYRALWVPGGLGGTLFDDVDALLGAAPPVTVATAVLNAWMHEPGETAAWVAGVRSRHPQRLLLGIGASHRAAIEPTGRQFAHPLNAVSTFLDGLQAAPEPVDAGELLIAALGPKMMELAGARTSGTHTFLVTADHTAFARRILGPTALVVPELKVVLTTDPARAREVARQHLRPHLSLPNYANNLVRLGFTGTDFAEGGTNRLVDAVVAWGSLDTIAQRLAAHLDAGVNHVCLHVIDDREPVQLVADWRALAPLAAS
jgi:probable F420-dependent oxidoreductase